MMSLDTTAAVAAILELNPDLGAEAAHALATAALAAAAVPPPKPAPLARPVPLKLDQAGLALMSPNERSATFRAHTAALESWIPLARSYVEPISEEAQQARDRIRELRERTDADTTAEKVARAEQIARLMEVVIAGGGSR